MRQVNIHQAKTHLSRLVEEAAAGESFMIAKAGKPMVVVTALEAAGTAGTSIIGCLEGEWTIPEDFNEMGQEEIIRMFEGGDDPVAP